MQFKELMNVVETFEEKVDDKVKLELKSYGAVDSMPAGLPKLEDVVEKYKNDDPEYVGGVTVICTAAVGDLWSDPTYNRIDALRYNNQKKHIKSRDGFSYVAADTLSAYLRPSLESVLTKGNNRASKRYACGRNPESRVVVSMKLHPKDISHDEMIRIESLDHNTDCNYRTTQSGDDKFKSAYYAQDGWAVSIYNFLKEFNIGVADTLDGATFRCLSHSYIQDARDKVDLESAKKYLKAFTENNCETEIAGTPTLAGTMFCNYFKDYIADVDKRNGVDSFSKMMDFWFNQYGDASRSIANPDSRNLTQSDITKGTGDNKCKELYVARFVFMYNTFCQVRRYNIEGSQKTAIPFNGSKTTAWLQFLETANPWMKGSLVNVAQTPIL